MWRGRFGRKGGFSMVLGGANRHDHTDWVIHFVRAREPAQDRPLDGIPDPVSQELEPDADAFQVLRTIIRLGGIIPGRSFRNGRTTIYGRTPVVCITEMPIYSFAMYARDRAAAGNASAYGIAFLKSELFAAGGRPAIYGLASDQTRYLHNEPTYRVLKPEILPEVEQFRYVAYDPSKRNGWLDWSHEREWRWIPRDTERDQIWAHGDEGIGPTPALPLLKGRIHGGYFTQIRLIVWSEDEARQVNELLTGFFLSGGNNYDTPFDKDLIRRSRIIVLDQVIDRVENCGDFNAQTIEGLDAAELLDPITVTIPPADADRRISEALNSATAAALSARDAFIAKHGSGWDAFGHASTVTYEITDPLVQRMLDTGKASGPFDGKVIIRLNGISGVGEISPLEHMHRAAADVLSQEIGVPFFASSSLD